MADLSSENKACGGNESWLADEADLFFHTFRTSVAK